MDGNAELLNFIYQNSEMGLDTLNQLVKITTDEQFKKHLQSQINEYRIINDEAIEKQHQSGCEEKGISKLSEIKTYMSINMQTLTDKTPSHIAQMLILGSTMGIIDAIKNAKRYMQAPKETLYLMDRLLKFEQENVEQLKQFL